MRKRSRPGGKAAEPRRRTTAKPKRRRLPNRIARRNPPAAREQDEVARLTRERDEALEQQTAASEVLRIISSSPGDLEPVFQTMLEKAVRICDAKFGSFYLHDEGRLRLVAAHEAPEFLEARGSGPIQPAPGGVLDVVMRTKRTVHIPDLAATRSYAERHPRMVEAVEIGGIRTVVAVPMLKNDDLIGVVAVHRREVRPFTNEQIALVQNFAAQAVIAIENARLLNELRRRTTDLTEALAQQTATSEVLQVISGSPGDIGPVFANILEKAVRYCDANIGTLYLHKETQLSLVAAHNMPTVFSTAHRDRPGTVPGGPVETAMRTKRTVHMPDLAATQSYLERHPRAVDAVELGGVRTVVAVPMLKDDEPIGVIAIHRPEVRLFADKQIELLKNFAAQAVIAIENARLLNELRQRTTDLTERTADLTEALEQQTATSEVLQVISGSPGDLEPMFSTMLQKATFLCEANFGILQIQESGGHRVAAMYNVPAAFAEHRQRMPLLLPTPKSAIGIAVATKRLVHLTDYAEDTAYKLGDPNATWLSLLVREASQSFRCLRMKS
jgi:two-component system, NtrC family, sensor kinase